MRTTTPTPPLTVTVKRMLKLLIILILAAVTVVRPAQAETTLNYQLAASSPLFAEGDKEPVCPVPDEELAVTGQRLLAGYVLSHAASLAKAMWPAPTVTERVNILLVGSDTRIGDKYGHTDTLIVVTIDPVAKTAAMLSIPRDLWVTIPGHGENRINQAYRLGELNHYPGGGPALLKETVSTSLGISVHRYISVNFEGFKQMVDALGDIELCVPEAIDAATYQGFTPQRIDKELFTSFVPVLAETDAATGDSIQTKDREFLYIEAGTHKLDAETALRYARSRDSIAGDFARVQRQQAVLLAMRAKALKLGMVPRIPQLWRALGHTFETDLKLGEVIQLARLAIEIPTEAIQPYAINHLHTTDYRTKAGARVLLPQQEAIEAIIYEIFGPAKAAADIAPVDVGIPLSIFTAYLRFDPGNP